MVSPEIVTLSVFITPWTNPTSIHRATRDAWAASTARNSARYGASASRGGRVVPADRVVGEPPQQRGVAGRPGVLEAADAQVAAGDPGQDGARQRRLAAHHPAGRDDGQRPRRRDAQRVHGLADHDLAQHRADRREAVAAPGERRAAGALEVQVAQGAARAGQLAEQQRPPVAEPGVEAAELVAGVGLRHRPGTRRDERAGEQLQPVR